MTRTEVASPTILLDTSQGVHIEAQWGPILMEVMVGHPTSPRTTPPHSLGQDGQAK